MTFQPGVMADVDSWVKRNADRMLFVYGQNDPWGAEPFHLGYTVRDSYVMIAPGANHGANVAKLQEGEKALATQKILQWAGVAPAAALADAGRATPLAKPDAVLDQKDQEREPQLRP